ncbi:MAG: zinc-ribbon domain-containing protein [Lachnospiraceae bacterium]|nr:zinc-ribbon domain-containing protein [Lachnospiraceae bacterium]
MVCPNCGKEVANGMRFCVSCGAPLQQNSASQPNSYRNAPQGQYGNAPQGQPRPNSGYGMNQQRPQGGYNQGGYNQGGYRQGGYNQGGYNQGGYNQGGYNQNSYNRRSPNQNPVAGMPGFQPQNPFWIGAVAGCALALLSVFIPFSKYASVIKQSGVQGLLLICLAVGCAVAFNMGKTLLAMLLAVAETNYFFIYLLSTIMASSMGIGMFTWFLGAGAMMVCTIFLYRQSGGRFW